MALTKKIISFPSHLATILLAWNDTRTPASAKIFLALSLAYLILPIDILPDVIPFAGWIDDLVIVPALMGLSYKQMPEALILEVKKKAKRKVRLIGFALFAGALLFLALVAYLIKVIFF
jgi:uncharacterized membrane protein YkvA (DUF1232 family)